MREIPLTRGVVAIVDDEDFDRLTMHKWHANEAHPGIFYARRTDAAKRVILMHRVILDAPDGSIVDHKNRNTLDNRRENLRLATSELNMANKGMARNNKTGYKGVRFCPAQKKNPYVAHIRQGTYRHIGVFPDAVSAALAYDREAYKLWGEYAGLNFPDIFLK